MKKLLLIISIVLGISSTAFCWNPFKGMIEAKIADEMNAVKLQVAAMVNNINTKITGIESKVNGDVSLLKGDISGVKAKNIELEQKINLQAQAVASINSQITSMGNNNKVNSGNTNDTGLLENIFKVISGIFMAVIAAMGTIIKGQGKTINDLTAKSDKLEHERDDQYAKLVASQSDLLDDLLKSKQEYKEKYLQMVEKK